MPESPHATSSVWIAGEPTTDYPPLAGDVTVDVAVVGGGITGLSTALMLASTGMRVAVIEARRVGAGVTGHSTAKLTALQGLVYRRLEQQFGPQAAGTYAAANLAGIEQVAAWVDELAIDCNFQRQPAYTFTCDPGRVDDVAREAEAARRAGLEAEFVTATQLPLPVLGAVRAARQAQFHPYRYCVRLAQALVERGGLIFEQTRAIDVRHGDPCEVQARRGIVRARQVVLATLLPFLDRGGFFARTHPSRSYGIAVKLETSAPEGMYINVESPARSVRPLADPQGMIVVGEDHKVGQDPDTTRRYAALESWARQWFPVTAVTHRWSAQDYIPADGLPFVGYLPLSSEKVLVVTGLNKWGLAMGTAAAALLVGLIAGRDHPWHALFDARRANLLESAQSLVAENLDVAKRFVGDRLHAIAAKNLDALPAGEGAIVIHDGKRWAAYREPGGAVQAVSPVCTHMGCYLQWNSAERSWDCPCHGSRFDLTGEILQGPAVRQLESKRVIHPE